MKNKQKTKLKFFLFFHIQHKSHNNDDENNINIVLTVKYSNGIIWRTVVVMNYVGMLGIRFENDLRLKD